MAAASKKPPVVKWVIDTHGMLAALRSKKNSVRVAVIDAIESGEMQILKSVSKELSALYPDDYENFKAIKNKKYLQVTVANKAAAGSLMERYGSGILGSIPTIEHFQAVAASIKAGCKLVSSGKAFTHCTAIAAKCKLGNDRVKAVETLPAVAEVYS
jgi:hypothetical protein